MGLLEASIFGGRRNLCLVAHPSLYCPWEEGGPLRRRITGLLLVAVAVSATASALNTSSLVAADDGDAGYVHVRHAAEVVGQAEGRLAELSFAGAAQHL